MARDDDRNRVEADGVGDGSHSRAILAHVGEVTVADESAALLAFGGGAWIVLAGGWGVVGGVRVDVVRMGQFPKFALDPFLEIGSEEHQVVPCGFLAELPDFIECDRLGLYFVEQRGIFAVGLGSDAPCRPFCSGKTCSYIGKDPVICRNPGDLSVNADDNPFSFGIHNLALW